MQADLHAGRMDLVTDRLEAFEAVGKQGRVDLIRRSRPPRIELDAAKTASGDADDLIHIPLAQIVHHQVRPKPRGGFLEPLAVKQRVRQSLRQLDASDGRQERAVWFGHGCGQADDGHPRPHEAELGITSGTQMPLGAIRAEGLGLIVAGQHAGGVLVVPGGVDQRPHVLRDVET